MNNTDIWDKNILNSDGNGSTLEGVDMDKLLNVLRKSAVWLIIVVLITNIGAYLMIRWTKPLYESTSQLKLDVKSEAQGLGINNINNLIEDQNINNISGEIELIKSELFLSKVLAQLDIGVSYYSSGKILNDERYRFSPFTVDFQIHNNKIYDKPITVRILDKERFVLSYTLGNEVYLEEHHFNQSISTKAFTISLLKSSNFSAVSDQDYFFIINSKVALIRYLNRNLDVTPLNLKANTIKISFQDFNRYKAYDIVNTIDSLYLEYSRLEKSLANTKKIEWLNGELKQIEEKLEGIEGYFEDFTIKNKTIDLSKDLSRTITFINDIDSQRYVLTQKLGEARAIRQKLSNGDELESVIVFDKVANEDVKALLQELEEVRSKKEKLLLSYNVETFAVQKMDQELKRMMVNIQDKLDALINSYGSSIAKLEKDKLSLEREFVSMPGKSTEYNKTQRFYGLYEQFYLSLMQSKAEFEIANAGTTTDFKILAPATFPMEPISPKKAIVHGIGMVTGIVLCFLIIGIWYLLDTKINSVDEIEKLSSAAILGLIPRYARDKVDTSLVVDLSPKSSISEALRTVRTNIEFMFGGKKKKIMSVTSTVGGEGKTFVTVNLGGIIALSKKKVVLVDLDMRKPKLHMAVGGKNDTIGVSTILIGKHNLEEALRESRLENLYYIAAGPTPPNPSELILSKAFDQLIENLKERFDIIILDTPPVGIVTDASLVMKKADLPIYVFRADYSKKSFVKSLNRLVHNNKFNNLAVVLNSVSKSRDHSYGYGYGYYEENSNGKFDLMKKRVKKK